MTEQDFYPGIRFAITWLHDRAKQMNDPKAKQILDSAAFSLGSAKARGGFVLDDHVTRELATLRARVEELEREVERAFRDGIAYATVCDVTDVDLAWQSSAALDRLTEMGESDG